MPGGRREGAGRPLPRPGLAWPLGPSPLVALGAVPPALLHEKAPSSSPHRARRTRLSGPGSGATSPHLPVASEAPGTPESAEWAGPRSPEPPRPLFPRVNAKSSLQPQGPARPALSPPRPLPLLQPHRLFLAVPPTGQAHPAPGPLHKWALPWSAAPFPLLVSPPGLRAQVPSSGKPPDITLTPQPFLPSQDLLSPRLSPPPQSSRQGLICPGPGCVLGGRGTWGAGTQ